MIQIEISRLHCFHEASRQAAYILSAASDEAETAHSATATASAHSAAASPPEPAVCIPSTSDAPLFQQLWEAACRDVDILLSRFRLGPSQGSLQQDYVARLHMPISFDSGLAPMLSGLVFNYFTAFLAAAFVRYVLPQKAPPLEQEVARRKQRVREALRLRRLPIRRPPVF